MIGERAASKKQQTGTYGVSERNVYEIAKDLVCIKMFWISCIQDKG